MSKSRKNGDRLGNSKRHFENKSKRLEVKQILKEGRFEDLDEEEEMIVEKEPDFKHSEDR